MLEKAKEKLVDELSSVSWAYQTTSRRPIGTILFALAYKIKVIISTKIGMFTIKTTVRETRNSNKDLEIHLDWVDEKNKAIAIQAASYQQRVVA